MKINPLLSILIPCTPDRKDDVAKLLAEISKQYYTRFCTVFDIGNMLCSRWNDVLSEIEVLTFTDNREMTIGEKRELLYNHSNGIFSWQVDSDDMIAQNAIELILNAIKSNPEVDCITFQEKCLMNGEYKKSNHSLRYSQWADNTDGYDYVRSPFYKDVIRTDIAKSVPFPHIRYNEDEQFSMALYPHLSTETHIDEELYYYIYEPKDSHAERYGIK